MTGGKFANGAITGAFSRLLNDDASNGEGHKGDDKGNRLRKVRPHSGEIVKKGPGIADGRFSAEGEFRRYPDGRPRPHLGIDISGEVGDSVVAAADGKVFFVCPASECNSSGNQVSISHPDGTVTRYFHLNSISVSQGDKVTAGAVIGTLGTTGNAAGTLQPHLHFEVRQGRLTGTPVDPEEWLNR